MQHTYLDVCRHGELEGSRLLLSVFSHCTHHRLQLVLLQSNILLWCRLWTNLIIKHRHTQCSLRPSPKLLRAYLCVDLCGEDLLSCLQHCRRRRRYRTLWLVTYHLGHLSVQTLWLVTHHLGHLSVQTLWLAIHIIGHTLFECPSCIWVVHDWSLASPKHLYSTIHIASSFVLG